MVMAHSHKSKTSPSVRGERKLAAGEFKAKCLSVLDQVAEDREAVVITKRGVPVAKLVPIERPDARARLKGSVLRFVDPLLPIDEEWETDR